MRSLPSALVIVILCLFIGAGDCSGNQCPEGQELVNGTCLPADPQRAEKVACEVEAGAVWADLGEAGSECIRDQNACEYQAGTWYTNWCLYAPEMLICSRLNEERCGTVSKCAMTKDLFPTCADVDEAVCEKTGHVWNDAMDECVSAAHDTCLQDPKALDWLQNNCVYDCKKMEGRENCLNRIYANNGYFGYCDFDGASEDCSVACEGLSSAGTNNQKACSALGCTWVVGSSQCLDREKGCVQNGGEWKLNEGCFYNSTPVCVLQYFDDEVCKLDVACEWTGKRCVNKGEELCKAPLIWYEDECMLAKKKSCVEQGDIWTSEDDGLSGLCELSPEHVCTNVKKGFWDSDALSCKPGHYDTCAKYDFTQPDPGYEWQEACASRSDLGCAWVPRPFDTTGAGNCHSEKTCKEAGLAWLFGRCEKPYSDNDQAGFAKSVVIPRCENDIPAEVQISDRFYLDWEFQPTISEVSLCYDDRGIQIGLNNKFSGNFQPTVGYNEFGGCNHKNLRDQSGVGLTIYPISSAAELQSTPSSFTEYFWAPTGGKMAIQNLGVGTPPKYGNPPSYGTFIDCGLQSSYLEPGKKYDYSWRLRATIPFETIGGHGGSGQVFKADLYRKIMRDKSSEPCTPETCEYRMWLPTYSNIREPNFYVPKNFGLFVLQ